MAAALAARRRSRRSGCELAGAVDAVVTVEVRVALDALVGRSAIQVAI
jgi:hypothetical protein